MSPEMENEVLASVALNRRGFVKKVVLGSAFAVPLVASFDMRSLNASAADCLSPNQTDEDDGRFAIHVLKARRTGDGPLVVKIRVRDASSGANAAREGRKVVLQNVDPTPPHHAPSLPKRFEFKSSKKLGRYYELDLNTKGWGDSYYFLYYTVGNDATQFTVAVYLGGC